MRRSLLGLVLSTLAVAAYTASAQPPKAQTPRQPATASAPPSTAAKSNEPLATVNGESILRNDILKLMGQIELGPDATPEDAYQMAVNMLVNTQLLVQYLNGRNITVTRKELDDEMRDITDELKKQGKEIGSMISETGLTKREIEKQITNAKLWEKYFRAQSGDAALKTFVERNKDYFNGAKVRARHILLKVDPQAKPEEKAKVKEKLVQIKKEIVEKGLDFADAANKYSEDDGNVQVKSGGDLGTFRRKGDLIEEFASVAFGLKPGVVSDPVETEFGYHLILVTERDDGTALDFVKEKPFILQQYELDLREKVIMEARSKAKIEVKPMPKDLVATAKAAEPAAPAATAKTKAATKSAGSQ